MTISSDHDKIIDELDLIRTQIAKYEGKIAILRAEESELIIAEKIVAKLSGISKPVEVIENNSQFRKSHTVKKKFVKSKAAERPVGIPSTPEMIQRVISSEMKAGGTGLTSKDIVARIESEWWPNVDPNFIAPAAWRLAKEGRLKKVGDRYVLSDVHLGEMEIGKDTSLTNR